MTWSLVSGGVGEGCSVEEDIAAVGTVAADFAAADNDEDVMDSTGTTFAVVFLDFRGALRAVVAVVAAALCSWLG